MSTPAKHQIWVDPVTGVAYDAATMEPIHSAGADLGEKRRMVDGPPLDDDDLEEFARQLAGRAKLGKNKPNQDHQAQVTHHACVTCDGSGHKARGWAGQPARDGRSCPDCHGSGIDRTPYGTGSDHCPHCGADWKREHADDCVARSHR